MKIGIGADHRGFALKSDLSKLLLLEGHHLEDVGAHQYEPEDDYADFAQAVGNLVASNRVDKGIIICGSGVGASITANKVAGARAAICHDLFSAEQGVRHDDMNVLCLGACVVESKLAFRLAQSFLAARFDPQPKYVRRLEKVINLEKRMVSE